MSLSDRLRLFRTNRNFSVQDIVKRTGFSHSFVTRVENGHDVPDMDALEIWAVALRVPVHELFYDGEEAPPLQNLPRRLTVEEIVLSGVLRKFRLAVWHR